MRHVTTLTLTAALLAIGCGSDDNSFPIGPFPNPTPIVTAPIAVADSFTTLGNSILTGSVIANDTLNGATVTAVQNPSNSGGSVAITSSGTLTYTPPLNSTNVNDTFTYTLTNSAGSSTASVTVQIGARGFFVKNDAPGGGTGTQSNPFNTLAAAVTAATGVNGAQIVVFRGNGTSSGQNTPVALGTNQGILAQDPANPPTLTGPITLGQGNTLTNLRLFNSPGVAINGNAAVNGTLTGLAVANTTDASLTFNGATGIILAQNCSVSNSASHAFIANCTTGILNWTASNCSFNGNLGVDAVVNVTGTASQNVTLQNCIDTQSRAFAALRGNAGTIGITANNNTVNGGGVTLRAFDILTNGTAQLSGRITSNNVTGCTQEGVLLGTDGNSTSRLRFNQNRLLGNFSGFASGSTQNGNMGLALTNNTSDVLGIGQVNPSISAVEGLANLITTLGNTGTVTTTGTVQDVPVGSLGIP